MIKLPIEIGDILLVGRFKNKRIKVKEIGTDEHGLPTVNGRGILKIRIEKLMEPKKQIKESKQFSLAQAAKKILKEAKKPETGLMVIGKTPLDNNSIGDMIEELGYYAEWNSREGYWLFLEEEDTYDALEAELEREFSKRGIAARFEGIF